MIICLIQHFEADFLWKVSLKILNSGIILKTLTHVVLEAGALVSIIKLGQLILLVLMFLLVGLDN